MKKLSKHTWFEYTLPFTINTLGIQWIQPSIETTNEYGVVCFLKFHVKNTILKSNYI